ncbi:MAG: type IV pilus modification protein PilV [Pseudomonadota bacterium]
MKPFDSRLTPSHRMTCLRSFRAQHGLTLIEILITLLVLAIGLLGLAALQGFSLQSGQASYYRTQATNMAYEVADFTRANRSIATAGWVQAEFTDRVADVLPSGTVAVVLNNDQLAVTIRWLEDRVDENAAGQVESFTINTQI